MGRSFLSIKLAVVFGLLVAGAVTAQQQLLTERHERATEVAVPAAAVETHDCAERVTVPVRTPPATAIAPRAAAAARS
jgi:hypothetical protein